MSSDELRIRPPQNAVHIPSVYQQVPVKTHGVKRDRDVATRDRLQHNDYTQTQKHRQTALHKTTIIPSNNNNAYNTSASIPLHNAITRGQQSASNTNYTYTPYNLSSFAQGVAGKSPITSSSPYTKHSIRPQTHQQRPLNLSHHTATQPSYSPIRPGYAPNGSIQQRKAHTIVGSNNLIMPPSQRYGNPPQLANTMSHQLNEYGTTQRLQKLYPPPHQQAQLAMPNLSQHTQNLQIAKTNMLLGTGPSISTSQQRRQIQNMHAQQLHQQAQQQKQLHPQRTSKDLEHNGNIKHKINEAIAHDIDLVLHPNYKDKFESQEDARNRLSCYHLYQYFDEEATLDAQRNSLDASNKRLVAAFESLESRVNNLILADKKQNVLEDILAGRLIKSDEMESLRKLTTFDLPMFERERAINAQRQQEKSIAEEVPLRIDDGLLSSDLLLNFDPSPDNVYKGTGID